MKVKHLAIIPILLSLLYLLPIFSLEDKWIIFLQNYGNFFIYFILGLFLSVISSSTKRSSLLLLLACSSLISQTLQMSFDDRQFDFGTILLNILGSTAGIYFFFLLVFLNKVIYRILNERIQYKEDIEELIISLDEVGQEKPNEIKQILRNIHFFLNKYLREEDNINIDLKTIFGEKILFPVMSGNIFKHIFYGTPEADTLLILKENTKLSFTALDLGAHYGFFSLFLSNLVGDQGKIFSFEPTESTYNILKKNTQHKGNISIHNQGFFSSEVSITFNHYGDNYSGLNSIYSPRLQEKLTPDQQVKKFVALDDFCKERNIFPDLIKIDCESSEFEILRGSVQILEEVRPILVIEFGDVLGKDLPRSSAVFDFLNTHSYRAFRRYKEGYKEQERQEYYDYFNCLFVPEEQVKDFYSSKKMIKV